MSQDQKQKVFIYRVLTEESRKDGRPNRYNSEYHPEAAHEIMKLGATKRKCAEILGIHHDTLYAWMRSYPEFSDAIQRGIDEFTSGQVEHALHKRAVGFKYDEKHYEKPQLPPIYITGMERTKKEKDLLRNEIILMLTASIEQLPPVLTKKITKYYPPDTAAIKFFLGNRDGQRWPKNGDTPGEGGFLFFTQKDVEQWLAEEKAMLGRLPKLKKGGTKNAEEKDSGE